MTGQVRLVALLALSALWLGVHVAGAPLQGLQFDFGSVSGWPANVLVLTSYAGPDECWGYATGDGEPQENLQGLAILVPSVQGDITKLATPPPRNMEIRQPVALTGLTEGSTFSGACDSYDTLNDNGYDAEDSKCTFVVTAVPDSGIVGLNFTRTNGTQPYTCSLQYEVVSLNGTAFMGVQPVPRYITALRNVTTQADCPAAVTKCLGEPGWQMNMTSRAMSFVMLEYVYSASKCAMYGSGYFHDNGYIGWEPVYADGPALYFGGSTAGFNATAVAGANQLNVTFWNSAGDSTLGLPPYNCTVIFEVDAAFYQQFTGQKVTATPAIPAATPSPPPQSCNCPCECSARGAKPAAA